MTDAQRAEIRRYLGYSDQSRGYYNTLDGVIAILSPEAEEIIVSILTELAEIEAQIRDARRCRLMATRVEDITLSSYDEIRGLRLEGQRLARDISTILGVKIFQTPFMSAPSTGAGQRA